MNNNFNRGTFGSTDWLMGAVKKNPEGLLLLAAGCALLMRSGSSWLGSAASGSGSSNGSFNNQPQHHPSSAPRGDRGSDWGVTEGISRTAETARDYASD